MANTDIFAFIFFLTSILITFYFECFKVINFIFKDYPLNSSLLFDKEWKKYVHYLLSFYILHNIIGNLYLIIKTDTSIRNIILPQAKKWKYCTVCECQIPPRSHHCKQCNICILKRTHHCIFFNTCIGHKNFKYFFALLIYISLGTFYSSFLNMFYVWPILGGFNIQNVFIHTFPFMFWVAGKISINTTLICLISVINICGFFFCTCLVFYHGQLLISNQTIHEKNQQIKIYDLGNKKSNLEESLGKRWYLVCISPFINSRLVSDGIEFRENQIHGFKTK